MEQIFFCGDNHGRFEHLIEAVYEHAPDALVLLGDVQAQRSLEEELADILDSTQVWFIHGNHDTDSEDDYDNLLGSKLAHRNLHGRVVDIAGVRIGGLGGIFREQVWKPPEPPKSESAKRIHAHCWTLRSLEGRAPIAASQHDFPGRLRCTGQATSRRTGDP